MGKSAGVITLRMKAGTAELFTDLDKAKAKVVQFGGSAKTSNAEVAATVKALEGNFNGATRAVSRFLGQTLGLGPIIQKAFPVVGAVLLGQAVVETGEKVYKFFKDIQEAPQKVASAFRQLNQPLALTNDELRVTNDRLENDIAKLEGKRQNTLKLALDEARKSADGLADSLDKNLASLNKLLKEQNVGFLRKLLGESGTDDVGKEFGGSTGHEGFIGKIDEITDEGNEKIRQAKDLKSKDAAQTELNTRLLAAYGEEVSKVNKLLGDSQRLQNERENPRKPDVHGFAADTSAANKVPDDQSARLAALRGVLRNLKAEMDNISLNAVGNVLGDKKAKLEADKSAAELTKPFRDRIAALNAELEASFAKLGVAGGSPEAQLLVKAYDESLKAITEINKATELKTGKLKEDEQQQIKNLRVQIDRNNADAEQKQKLAETTRSIQQQIVAHQMLADAIGKGYEAQRRANIETQTLNRVGLQDYTDPKKSGAVSDVRAAVTREVDEARRQSSAAAVDALQNEIGLQQRLIEAQRLGEEEVRRIMALDIIRAGIARGASGAEIAAEVTKHYGAIRLEQEKRIVATQAETQYVQRLAAAQLEGAEAARKQALENKYAEMQRTGQGSAVAAERAKDEASRQAEITGKVAERLNVYRDELAAIDQERDALLTVLEGRKADADTTRLLKELDDQRLRVLRDQALATGKVRDGVRAFFLEMEASAKKPGQILYEGMMSAVDGVSDALARFFTGQKANFTQMLKGIGEGVLREALKAGIAKGLGALGNLIGIQGGGSTLPHFTTADPGHVIVDNLSAVRSESGSAKGSQNDGGGVLSALGAGLSAVGVLAGMFGLGGGIAPKEQVTSSIQYRAGGGTVSPSDAYIVGERGPELLTGASGRIISNDAMRRNFGEGDKYQVIIHAPGADLGAANRISQAVDYGRRAAVIDSARAATERARRTPQRGA